MAIFKRSEAEFIKEIEDFEKWANKRSVEIRKGNIEVREKDMPPLAKVICGGKTEIAKLSSEERKKYEKIFDKKKDAEIGLTLLPVATGVAVKGAGVAAIASGVGVAGAFTSLGAIGATSGIVGASALSGLGIASLGATAFIPALWPVGISIAVAGIGSIFKNNAGKKKGDRTEKSVDGLEKIFNNCQKGAQNCAEQIKRNNEEIDSTILKKIKKALDNLSDTAEKVKIKIDDALNIDQNKRIMQYQEIVLKQYNSQNEIRKTLGELIEAYNKLKVENEELSKKIAAYESLMKQTACANNFAQE